MSSNPTIPQWLVNVTGPNIRSGTTDIGRQPNLSFDPNAFAITTDEINQQTNVALLTASTGYAAAEGLSLNNEIYFSLNVAAGSNISIASGSGNQLVFSAVGGTTTAPGQGISIANATASLNLKPSTGLLFVTGSGTQTSIFNTKTGDDQASYIVAASTASLPNASLLGAGTGVSVSGATVALNARAGFGITITSGSGNQVVISNTGGIAVGEGLSLNNATASLNVVGGNGILITSGSGNQISIAQPSLNASQLVFGSSTGAPGQDPGLTWNGAQQLTIGGSTGSVGIVFASAVTASISQASPGSDAATHDLIIQSQGPFAGATTNTGSGNVRIIAPAPIKGVPGALSFATSGSQQLQLGGLSTDFIALGGMTLSNSAGGSATAQAASVGFLRLPFASSTQTIIAYRGSSGLSDQQILTNNNGTVALFGGVQTQIGSSGQLTVAGSNVTLSSPMTINAGIPTAPGGGLGPRIGGNLAGGLVCAVSGVNNAMSSGSMTMTVVPPLLGVQSYHAGQIVQYFTCGTVGANGGNVILSGSVPSAHQSVLLNVQAIGRCVITGSSTSLDDTFSSTGIFTFFRGVGNAVSVGNPTITSTAFNNSAMSASVLSAAVAGGTPEVVLTMNVSSGSLGTWAITLWADGVIN